MTKRKILASILVLAGLCFTSVSQAAKEIPVEQRAHACATLVDKFKLVYELHEKGVAERLVEEIVAREPGLDPVLGWPLAVANIVLYRMDKVPSLPEWIYGTQLGCIAIIGTDFLSPTFTGRITDGLPRISA